MRYFTEPYAYSRANQKMQGPADHLHMQSVRKPKPTTQLTPQEIKECHIVLFGIYARNSNAKISEWLESIWGQIHMDEKPNIQSTSRYWVGGNH